METEFVYANFWLLASKA